MPDDKDKPSDLDEGREMLMDSVQGDTAIDSKYLALGKVAAAGFSFYFLPRISVAIGYLLVGGKIADSSYERDSLEWLFTLFFWLPIVAVGFFKKSVEAVLQVMR